MIIREAAHGDLQPLLELYTHLHDHGMLNEMPQMDEDIERIWREILEDKNHHIIAGMVDGRIICSCVVVIVRNLTRQQRPYALIENVVTHAEHRRKGYASALLAHAREIALGESCYKVMLMTGSKKEETLRFYERAGFNRNDKTAFIQWL